MKEVIFTYEDERCHATIVDSIKGTERYIGDVDGYEIYQVSAMFDQFGFVAVERR